MAWQDQPRAGGKWVKGGGGGESVGGIEATVSVDTQSFSPAIERILSDLNRVEQGFVSTATATHRLDTATKQAGSGMTSFGNRMLIIGQMTDDAQYGISALVNQVPQFAMAFGMGAGVAGVLSIVAVAGNQLVKQWDRIAATFGESKTLTAAEEMEKLAKATNRTAEETERLNKLKKEQQQIETQTNRRPAAEEKEGRDAGGVIKEADAEVIRSAIRKRLLETIKVTDEEVEKVAGPERREAMQGRAGRGLTPERLEEIRQDLLDKKAAAATADAANLLRAAEFGVGKEGRDARERLGKMAREDPENLGIFGLKLGEIGPEARGRAASLQGREAEAAANAKDVRDRHDAMGVEARHAAEEEAMAQARRDEQDAKDTAALISEGNAGAAANDERIRREKDLARKMRENVRGFLKDDADLERLGERGASLDQRLMHLMNPTREGKSMSLDAYEQSHRSTTDNEQVRIRLAVEAVKKEIEKNNKNIAIIKRKPH